MPCLCPVIRPLTTAILVSILAACADNAPQPVSSSSAISNPATTATPGTPESTLTEKITGMHVSGRTAGDATTRWVNLADGTVLVITESGQGSRPSLTRWPGAWHISSKMQYCMLIHRDVRHGGDSSWCAPLISQPDGSYVIERRNGVRYVMQ